MGSIGTGLTRPLRRAFVPASLPVDSLETPRGRLPICHRLAKERGGVSGRRQAGRLFT
jgi:hypothetical protein